MCRTTGEASSTDSQDPGFLIRANGMAHAWWGYQSAHIFGTDCRHGSASGSSGIDRGGGNSLRIIIQRRDFITSGAYIGTLVGRAYSHRAI